MKHHPRRKFLRVVGTSSVTLVSRPMLGGSMLHSSMLGGSILGGSILGSSVLSGCGGEPEALDAGNIADVQLGVAKVLGGPAVVLRDAEGVYAMSTICTHQQCDIRHDGVITAQRLDCNCHGSAFDAVGNRIAGPALRSLPHLQIDLDGEGNMTVHTSQVVDASTRLPVPG